MTFNTLNTYDWFRQRVYKLESANHDYKDMGAAMVKAMEEITSNYAKMPIGLFYKVERPTYEDLDIALKNGPLIKQPMPTKERITSMLAECL